jgi:hypothetical protein
MKIINERTYSSDHNFHSLAPAAKTDQIRDRSRKACRELSRRPNSGVSNRYSSTDSMSTMRHFRCQARQRNRTNKLSNECNNIFPMTKLETAVDPLFLKAEDIYLATIEASFYLAMIEASFYLAMIEASF